VTLRGLDAIDQRTAPARTLVAWRAELVAALGSDDQLSPQRRRLVEMTTQAALDKLGLDRVPTKVTDLTTYVTEKYGKTAEKEGEVLSQSSPSSRGPRDPSPPIAPEEGTC
jgi:hypothetical protein